MIEQLLNQFTDTIYECHKNNHRLNWPLRRINWEVYKIIYRKSKKWSTALLTAIPNFSHREWDENYNMRANYFKL